MVVLVLGMVGAVGVVGVIVLGVVGTLVVGVVVAGILPVLVFTSVDSMSSSLVGSTSPVVGAQFCSCLINSQSSSIS